MRLDGEKREKPEKVSEEKRQWSAGDVDGDRDEYGTTAIMGIKLRV